MAMPSGQVEVRMRRVSLREVYRCEVVDEKGRQVGWINDVLFHPSEPRTVGYSVRPHLVSGVVPLPTKYLALDVTELNEDGELAVVAKQAAWGKSAAKKMGFSWEDTVIWYGQMVETSSGEHLGKVADALFSLEDGSLGGFQLTAGTVSDATLGKRSVPPAMVVGFDLDRHAVLVSDAAAAIVFEGGAATAAGKAVGEVGKQAEKAAEATVVAAATATVYAQEAVKKALKSPQGQKAKRWFGSVLADIKDAMGDDDE